MFTIRIAELNIRINNIYQTVFKYCKDYLINDNSDIDIYVNVTEDMINYEETKIKHPKEVLEITAVYRKICEEAFKYNCMLLHGSAIEVNNKGFIFTALSGTGKSTHTKLWIEVYKDKVKYINDDKPLLRLIDGKFYAYGTPWNGSSRLDRNVKVEISSICVLNRSENNWIKKGDSNEVLPSIMRQIMLPENKTNMEKTLELLDNLLRKVDLYIMGCNISKEAAIMAYNTMVKNN